MLVLPKGNGTLGKKKKKKWGYGSQLPNSIQCFSIYTMYSAALHVLLYNLSHVKSWVQEISIFQCNNYIYHVLLLMYYTLYQAICIHLF